MKELTDTRVHLQRLIERSDSVELKHLSSHWTLIASLAKTLQLAYSSYAREDEKPKLKINPIVKEPDDPAIP